MIARYLILRVEKIGFFYLFFLFTFTLYAQYQNNYRFEYLDISKGLSNNYVSKIITDKSGLKWFATERGLNLYDGVNYKLYKSGKKYPTLKNERVETLYCASNGIIWVGTESGILAYNPFLDKFSNINDLINKTRKSLVGIITGIIEDKDRNIWISSLKGELFMLSSDGTKLIEVFESKNNIINIEKDSFGNVWALSSEKYIYKYTYSEKKINKIPIAIKGPRTLFYDTKANRLLIGSTNGLFQFDIENYQIRELQSSVDANLERIKSINIDKSGRIWAGSWTQGLHISSDNQSKFHKVELLTNNLNNSNYETVLDIQIDETGVGWLATGYGGVVKLSPKDYIKYYTNTCENNIGLPDNNIQSIIKDKDDRLWCGTWEGGIGYSKDGENFIQLPKTTKTKVSCFLEIKETMFVGTKEGVFSYNISNPYKGSTNHVLKGDKIKSLYLDSNNFLWIGTQHNGLVAFNYSKDKSLNSGTWFNSLSKKGLDSDRISVITEDSNEKLWIGTHNGLYSYNPNTLQFIREDTNLKEVFPSVVVLSIFPDKNGMLWVSVSGGLLKVMDRKGKLELINSYGLNEGLKNDYITAITKDSQNNIWMSNVSGIATIRKDQNVLINLDNNPDYKYTMNINSFFNDGKTIFFGSSNGFFSFDPLDFSVPLTAPDIIFTSLKIDNKEVHAGEQVNGRKLLKNSIAYTDEINLTYKESVMSLEFVPADFSNSSNLNYYYRVKGLQKEWINNGNRGDISFVGLDAGDYLVEIKSTKDNINFGKTKSMHIVVTPPFWKSDTAYFIYFILLGLIIVVINKISVNHSRLKVNLEMEKMTIVKEKELNEMKLRFFTNVSHELRTPLTLIISPLSEILSTSMPYGEVREKLNYVDKNANKLLNLVNQLLDFRKADQGLLKLQVAQGDFMKFTKEIFLSFKSYAESKGVSFQFETSHNFIPLTYDRVKMEIVLCNMLSNAFKFTSIKGEVFLSLFLNDKYCIVKIRDNGKGISKKDQKNIFNRFFQIIDTESTKIIGSGIGLSLSEKIIALHHGDISINSELSNGTEFIISIPLGDRHFSKEDYLHSFTSTEDFEGYIDIEKDDSNLTEEMTLEDSHRETLLIVDDNNDIRSYLESLFRNAYKVITAENGLVAKGLAEEVIPDLIISDVMMTEMDGLELCKTLKSQIATSHIPIILLTARNSTVYEIDGLNTGADDYIKKPFDARAIQSRVITQLENRKRIRKHLRNKIRFETDSNVKAVNFEEKFIGQVFSIVIDHLDDTSFTHKVLGSKLFMSQSTLYRKIKSLTGMSISGFIRSVRLKKASEILLTQDLKLSAVAYAVGFNDYKYFKRAFINQFGISPREYRVIKKENTE